MADCTAVEDEVVSSNAEETLSGNEPLEITTNALSPDKVLNLDNDSLICNVVATAQTPAEIQNSLLEVDDSKHSQLEVSSLDSDPLSCNNIASVQTFCDTQEPPIGMEIKVLELSQLDVSKLNNDSLSCDNIEHFRIPFYKQSSPNDAEIHALQHSQLEVSNLNGDSLSCNDIASIQTPHDKLDADNDVSLSALDKTHSSQSEDYKISDIVWAKIGKYPFWPSVVCVDPKSNTYMKKSKTNKIGLHVRFCNDKGRRSWTSYFENYCGKLDLLTKYPNCLSYIKNNEKLLNVWNLAVEEAENLKKLDGDTRMLEFFKTFLNSEELNCLTPSALNSSSLDAATFSKVRTYSRKRPLTNSDQGKRSKLRKTDNSSVTGCSLKSIDISLLPKSDDVDSAVSDISMDDVFVKASCVAKKKKRSTKTYPPKNLYADKFNLSDFVNNYAENDDESDNSIILEEKTAIQTRWLPKTRKLEILTNEERYGNKSSKNSSDSGHSSTKIMRSTKSVIEMSSNSDDQHPNTTLYSRSSSTSKKTAWKKTPHEKESSRKSIAVKNESSPEPDTTESETSSKNETYSSVFLASTENKQLFVKCTKKACVVCKNYKHTVKCSGPCQSYFHKECLNISEERYSEPVNKIISKGKKQCLKPTHKNDDSIFSSPKIEHNILEESTIKSDQCDNFLSSPLNGENSTISEVDNENTKLENENEDLINLPNANKELVSEMSKKEIVDPSVKNENMPVEKDDKHNMCSLCKANKTHCYVCGFNIEDPEQKVVCKLCKLKQI